MNVQTNIENLSSQQRQLASDIKEIVIFLTKCVVRNQELALGKLNLK